MTKELKLLIDVNVVVVGIVVVVVFVVVAVVSYTNFVDKTKQDKATLLHFCTLDTAMADLAPQVADASRGGPGTVK